MPYLDTAQEWLTQSALLLKARPTTTRISTKYSINPPLDPSTTKERKPKPTPPTADTTAPAPPPAQEPIKAILTLKTFDPASGVTLKYSTTKAAEVSRLIQILGRLGRGQVGLEEKEDVVMTGGEAGEGVATPVVEAGKPGGQAGQGGAGGKKGKKKGKK